MSANSANMSLDIALALFGLSIVTTEICDPWALRVMDMKFLLPTKGIMTIEI
tara:strand:- start:540 stop:695 length:156 start_codon:yes stop_codon:yes gene_type:complete